MHFLKSILCSLPALIFIYSSSVLALNDPASASQLEHLWSSTTRSLYQCKGYMNPEMLSLYSRALSCSYMLGSSKSDGDWICQTTAPVPSAGASTKRLQCDQMALEILASYGDKVSSEHLMRHAKTVYSPFSLYALTLLSQSPLSTYTPELLEHILVLKRQYPYFSAAAIALITQFPAHSTHQHITKWFFEGNLSTRSSLLFYLAQSPHLYIDELPQCLAHQQQSGDMGINALLLRLIAMRPDLSHAMPHFVEEMVQCRLPLLQKRALSILYTQSLSSKDGEKWAQSLTLDKPEEFSSPLLVCDQTGKPLPQKLQERLDSLLLSKDPALRINAGLCLAATGDIQGFLTLLQELNTPKNIHFKHQGTLPYWQTSSEKVARTLQGTRDDLFFQQILLAYASRLPLDHEQVHDAIDKLAVEQDFAKSYLAIEIARHLPRKRQLHLYKKWALQPGHPLLRIAALTQWLSIETMHESSLQLQQLKEELEHVELPPLSLPYIATPEKEETDRFSIPSKRLIMQAQWQLYKNALQVIQKQDRAPRDFLKRLFEATTEVDRRLFLSKLFYERYALG